ncbi:MAG: hypothetical protein KDD63_16890, partial [Bacteroidetes bacterium]|nr:hypothetical protein [Bacteroidota bacterium]
VVGVYCKIIFNNNLMRSIILSLTLVFLLLFSACKKAVNESFCENYFTAYVVPQPFVEEVYPGYKIPHFIDDSKQTIFCFLEKKEKSQVIRYDLNKDKTKVLFEQKEPIEHIAYSSAGDIAFIHDSKTYVLTGDATEPAQLQTSVEFGQIKWYGDKLIGQTDLGSLVVMDQQGNISQQWNLLTPIYDYWANDSFLITANTDSITAFKTSDLSYQWSFLTQSFFEDLGTVVYMSNNTISVTGKYDPLEGLSDVVFSTPDQMYKYNVLSKEIISLWERRDCYVLEHGLSVSPDGNRIVTTISTVYSITQKQFGLMLLDMEGNWEILDL